ncbi:MAG: hypothetical protein J5J00_06585 [Deltaproteobacteria bacterium]|nr:hypothetical protein [Deltaproteobacteria bacterium]
MRQERANHSGAEHFFGAVVILLLSSLALLYHFPIRLSWLTHSSYPNNTDGFYYLTELREQITHGRSYFGESSPFFAITAFFAEALGQSEWEAYRGAGLVALTLLSISFGAIALGKGASIVAALLPMLLPWISDIIFFQSWIFLKQYFAAALVSAGAAMLAVQVRHALPKYALWTAAVALFIFAAATHKIAIPVAAAVAAGELISRSSYRKEILLSVSLGMLAWFLFASATQPSPLIAPMSEWKFSVTAACDYMNCSQFERAELIAILSLALIVLPRAAYLRIGEPHAVLLALLIVALHLPVWSASGGAAFRFSAASVATGYLALSYLAGGRTWLLGRYGMVAFAAILVSFSVTMQRKEYRSELRGINELITFREALLDWIPQDSFVQAPHGLQFAVTYYLDRRSAKRALDRSGPEANDFKISYLPPRAGSCHTAQAGEKFPPEAACVALGSPPKIYIERFFN